MKQELEKLIQELNKKVADGIATENEKVELRRLKVHSALVG